MSVVQKIKDWPLAAMIGTVIALVTALFSVDARYAHATDVQNDKVQTQQLIKDTSRNLRKQMLEDKLFELDVKIEQARNENKPPSSVDTALKERFKRQLEDLTRAR